MANSFPFSLLLLFLLSLLHPLSTGTAQPTSPPFPASVPPTRHSISAVFAFGDSTLDAGNNNHLPNPTFVLADHPPYGLDFPRGISTGRFSNGRLITDSLVAALGLKDSLPAFLAGDLTPLDLLTGVSFASAGSGLEDLTATQSGVMTVAEQLSNFAAYLGRFNGTAAAAAPVIRNALFIVGAGSNDMMMNFYCVHSGGVPRPSP
ncbi:GDSL esterase/lipase [Apostasia shenzhenica]|uniref:GDSL esterase/lipase n=1 Tax=Apostasia shenzhenica TaxID=1088818 RepID=A0A2I0AYX5_9ASPA|nr:GDSL esterase/lipase [Apostasia shenzhenica]